MDTTWGTIRDAATKVLGKLQGQITFGGGQPTAGSVSFGENRVMSVWVLGAAVVIGFLIARVLKGSK